MLGLVLTLVVLALAAIAALIMQSRVVQPTCTPESGSAPRRSLISRERSTTAFELGSLGQSAVLRGDSLDVSRQRERRAAVACGRRWCG